MTIALAGPCPASTTESGPASTAQSRRAGAPCDPGSAAADPLLPVVGADTQVPLVHGGYVRYANLDIAASAPALASVAEHVARLLPWYASVHRGAGYASRVSTTVYERAREAVARFVGAAADQIVVFTRNTTDALSLLASATPGEAVLLDIEHHANLLPWQRRGDRIVPAGPTLAATLDAVDAELRRRPAALLTVTGASNVTGECLPLAALARLAHRRGARLAVDAAQLAPHRRIAAQLVGAASGGRSPAAQLVGAASGERSPAAQLVGAASGGRSPAAQLVGAASGERSPAAAEDGVDYLALSGHKVYAPYGAGVLVGRRDWLDAAPAYLAGGGAVRDVTVAGTAWASAPERHEGGSPNVLGVAALAHACGELAALPADAWAAHERALRGRLVAGLAGLGIAPLRLWPDGSEPVGVVSFTVPGEPAGKVAAYLSAEHGIGVRDGRFCAHPLLRRLGTEAAVRASFGVGSTAADIDRLLAALAQLRDGGARWAYARTRDGWSPVPETRRLPGWLGGGRLAEAAAPGRRGGSSPCALD